MLTAYHKAYRNRLTELMLGFATKQAELRQEVILYETQSHGVKRFLKNEGRLVLAHGTGTGKTLTSAAAAEAGRKRGTVKHVLVIAPTGLRENYARTVREFTDQSVQIIGSQAEVRKGKAEPFDTSQKASYTVIGYELFRRDPEELVRRLGIDTMIVDEAHRARNMDSRTYTALMEARKHVDNAIAMTASESANHPADILPLVDFVTNGEFEIQTKKEFRRRFTEIEGYEEGIRGGKKPVYGLKEEDELKELIGKYVDYIDREAMSSDRFPKSETNVVKVEMSPRQKLLYDYAMAQAGPLATQLVRRGAPPNAKDFNHIFTRLQYARQVSNSTHVLDSSQSLEEAAETTPKVRRLLNDVQEHLKKTPDGQIIVYSNFIKGGADVVTAGLKSRGVPYGIFLGKGNPGSSEAERQQAVEDYRNGDIRVLVISGAGAEGLDLPNTTMLLMLDGHFSPGRIEQAEARGVRSGGLSHRPPDRRIVQIRRYVSTKGDEHTVDDWVYQVAERKDRLIREFRSLLRETNPDIYEAREDIEHLRSERLPSISLSEDAQKALPSLDAGSVSKIVPRGEKPEVLGKPSKIELVKAKKAPEGVKIKRKYKYLSRWRGPDGEWRYRYPKEASLMGALVLHKEGGLDQLLAGVFRRLRGSQEAELQALLNPETRSFLKYQVGTRGTAGVTSPVLSSENQQQQPDFPQSPPIRTVTPRT